MPQLTQGLIIAVLIGLLLAIIVGYYLRQGQVNELSEALHQSQKRQENLAQEHEQRLRDATAQLQKDYEMQLAENMEHYQAQYDEQRSQLEAEYRTRLSMAEGGVAGDADSTIEQRIRKQYETRLKEAAAKIQQAYEQHLQEKLVEAQQGYDQRLAAAIASYQNETQAGLGQAPSNLSLADLGAGSSAIESVNSTDLAEVEARLQSSYEQRLTDRLADYQDDMNQRLAQMEQDYEARLTMAQASASAASPAAAEPSTEELELNLRRELEASLREEYEQKLAEKIEHYQDELTQRTQELEQSYEARLQLLQPGSAAPPASVNDPGEFDLDSAIAAANAARLAASAEPDLGFEDTSSFEAASPSVDADTGFDTSLDGGLENAQSDEFGLDSSFDAEELDATRIETGLALEDALSPEPAPPSPTDADMGFDSLDGDLESNQGGDFGLDSSFGTDNLDATSIETDLDLENSSFESSLSTDDDMGFGTFSDIDLESNQSDEFGLESSFGTDDLEATTIETGLELEDTLSTEPAPSPSTDADMDFNFLDSDLESDQNDEFGLDSSFDADNLDLDALLNARAPDKASDDLMESLDDISDLS